MPQLLNFSISFSVAASSGRSTAAAVNGITTDIIVAKHIADNFIFDSRIHAFSINFFIISLMVFFVYVRSNLLISTL